MIAVDTNILVYAHRREASFHERARGRMNALVGGSARWALPWPCAHEFLANVTHPRIYKTPTPLPRALEQLSQWMSSPSVAMLAETDGYRAVLDDALASSAVVGARIHDARIAALCMLHGVVELWSLDRDFARFRGVRVKNPLTD